MTKCHQFRINHEGIRTKQFKDKDPSVIPLPGLSTKKVTSLSKTFGSEAKLLAALKGWGDSER